MPEDRADPARPSAGDAGPKRRERADTDTGATGPVPGPGRRRTRFPATPEAVRAALLEAHGTLAGWGYPEPLCEVAELVMAEALNNVVEHAYADEAGEIVLRVRAAGTGVACLIYDMGAPMPDGPPDPATPTPEPGGACPEGGFGWPMIRMLCSRVRYRRHRGGNALFVVISPLTGL